MLAFLPAAALAAVFTHPVTTAPSVTDAPTEEAPSDDAVLTVPSLVG